MPAGVPVRQFELVACAEASVASADQLAGPIPGADTSAPEYPAEFHLNDLDGTKGFAIAVPFVLNNRPAVGGVGDFNSDGFDDMVVGVPNFGGGYEGRSYLVFGASNGFPGTLDPEDLNGTDGVKLNGARSYDASGASVSNSGDVNGDGFDDLLIGAPSMQSGDIGRSYLVFGAPEGFEDEFDLGDLDGSSGLTLLGVSSNDGSGSSASSAGDVNGDGFDDIIIGAPGAKTKNGEASGRSYVVFGSADGFPAGLILALLDGSDGFVLNGAGSSVSGAGDVNGDGFDDIIIGAPGAYGYDGSYTPGQSYVVFGSASGFPAELDLGALDGKNGFKLNGVSIGDHAGFSVSGDGDINGDGFDDIIIGAPGAKTKNGEASGRSYVVFGSASGFPAELDLGALDGKNGFKLNGVSIGDRAGSSVSGAGDVNGDGFDDLLVGAPGALPTYQFYNNYGAGREGRGQSYVVFGAAGGFEPDVDLGSLNGHAGFALNGVSDVDGSGNSVSAAGDVNSDGFDDIIVGSAPWADFSGRAYVVFGGPMLGSPVAGTDRNDRLTGTKLGETMSGLAGSDRIRGRNGPDTLFGNEGDDRLYGGKGADHLDGGRGGDRMEGGPGDDTYVVGHPDDRVIEVADEDVDTVESRMSYVLPDPIRHLFLIGNKATDGTGNALDNQITGNAANNRLKGGKGNDVLIGGGGADRMEGGTGLDIYVVDHVGDEVIETEVAHYERNAVFSSISFHLPDAVHDLDLTGSDAINGTGNALDNQISGNDSRNRLKGWDGNDDIWGGSGRDRIEGGTGRDYLGGQDGNDRIYGGSGTDYMYGGRGADRLFGGDGNDGLFGDRGNDTLRGGNGRDDLLGESGDDTLLGEDDRDNLEGGSGDDELFGGTGEDKLFGDDGRDALKGGGQDDSLNGGNGGDVLKGGRGEDLIIGGLGTDRLIGGSDSDAFRYLETAESRPGEKSDTIADFERGTDVVDLQKIDAREDKPGSQSFDFIGTAKFTGESGELRFKKGILRGDTDGDGESDFEVRILDVARMDEVDFLL